MDWGDCFGGTDGFDGMIRHVFQFRFGCWRDNRFGRSSD